MADLNIFFLGSQTCQLRALVEHDASEPTVSLYVASAADIRAILSHLDTSETYSFEDAHAGVYPDGMHAHPVPRAALDAMRPYEGKIKLLMDRGNLTGASAAEVHRLYVKYIAIWSHLLKVKRPDAVLMNGVPHSGFSYTLFALSVLFDIPFGYTFQTQLKERVVLLESPEDATTAFPVPSLLKTRPPAHDLQPSRYARRGVERERNVAHARASLNLRALVRLGALVSPSAWGDLVTRRRRDYLGIHAVTGAEWRYRRFKLRRLMNRCLRDYERRSESQPSLRDPFVYYPLQVQPEASTVPLCGEMHDQLNNLLVLEAGLPEGWRILVKEHPQSARYRPRWDRGRSISFYDELFALPRTSVVSMDFPQADLLSSATVVAGTGTSMWEAASAGTPVFTFSRPWFSELPGVFHISSSEDVAEAIQRLGDDSAVDGSSFDDAARRLLDEYSYPGVVSDYELEQADDPSFLMRTYVEALIVFVEAKRAN